MAGTSGFDFFVGGSVEGAEGEVVVESVVGLVRLGAGVCFLSRWMSKKT